MIRISAVVLAVLAASAAMAGETDRAMDRLYETAERNAAERDRRYYEMRQQERLEYMREANDTLNAQMQAEAIDRGLGAIHEDLQHQNTLLCCPH